MRCLRSEGRARLSGHSHAKADHALRTACAVFHDDAQRLRWTLRQRRTIFLLLLQRFGAMIGNTAKGHRLRPATPWRVTVESWLRCQGLIVIRQNQNVSTTFSKSWSHN